MAKNPRLIDHSGQRFGKWTVGAQAGNTIRGGALWTCTCDCGTVRAVLGADLRHGKSKCCGCDTSYMTERNTTHGQADTRLYNTWQNMRARCYGKYSTSYQNYGGRGIQVCAEWSDFTAFQKWALSAGYRDDLTIERKNVDGDYTPENCTWIPKEQQSQNRRMVRRAPDGELWWHKARRNGITNAAFRIRMLEGWPPEQAVSWPMHKKREEPPRDENGRFV